MKKVEERALVVDFLRWMADQSPPADIVARQPKLGDPAYVLIGQSMLRSCAMLIEQGAHEELAKEQGIEVEDGE